MPGIGDVVYYNGGSYPYVIYSITNYEDYGSCCYDRDYQLIPLECLKDGEEINYSELWTVSVKGVTRLPFKIVEGETPYKFNKIVKVIANKKKAKSITIYE